MKNSGYSTYIISTLTLFCLIGCSSSPPLSHITVQSPSVTEISTGSGVDPVPPALPLPEKADRSQRIQASLFTQDQKLPLTLMAQNGRVLTVWALAVGNWLWAYGPSSSVSFGGIRNWNIEPAGVPGTFRFVNTVTGSCITAYKNGLIHDRCNNNSRTQEFTVIPATNGGFFIKSLSQGRCVRYDIITSTVYSTVYMSVCPAPGMSNYDQIWYLAPALTDSTAE